MRRWVPWNTEARFPTAHAYGSCGSSARLNLEFNVGACWQGWHYRCASNASQRHLQRRKCHPATDVRRGNDVAGVRRAGVRSRCCTSGMNATATSCAHSHTSRTSHLVETLHAWFITPQPRSSLHNRRLKRRVTRRDQPVVCLETMHEKFCRTELTGSARCISAHHVPGSPERAGHRAIGAGTTLR